MSPANTIKSINPATGEVIGEVPIFGKDEVDETVAAARESFFEWSKLSFDKRAQFLQRIKKGMLRRKDEIADLVVKEIGKPKFEALVFDIHFSLRDLDYWAKNTEKLLKDESINVGMEFPGVKGKVVFEPAGIVAIISPFNYPFEICFHSLTPALMAGNVVIVKPSEYGSLSALKIKEIIDDVGLPASVVSFVTGDGTTGQALVESDIDRVVFIGGVSTGRKIMRAASERLHPVVLELGGCSPAIVCKDANLEKAANGVVWSAFIDSGQTCANTRRVYVDEAIAEEFIERVAEKTRALKVGFGSDPEVEIGPVISKSVLKTLVDNISDAVNKGAKIEVGGKVLTEIGELFYAPTILTNVNNGMLIMKEETFGPVLPIMIVSDEDEAIELANDSDLGLSASVWTKDVQKGQRISGRLRAGTVWINNRVETPAMPWGGIKNSGIGRISSRYGLLNYVNINGIITDGSKKTREGWWYPYNKRSLEYYDEILSLYHSGRVVDKIKAAVKLLRRPRESKGGL